MVHNAVLSDKPPRRTLTAQMRQMAACPLELRVMQHQDNDMNKAPWPDFDGKDIYEGDVIEHPSGERGTIIVIKDDAKKAKNYEWKVNYGDVILWLGSQIGDKGQAVVVHNAEIRGD